jgi:GTP cyclohydrolase I
MESFPDKKIKTARSLSKSRLLELKKKDRPESPDGSAGGSSVEGDGLCWPSTGTRVRKKESGEDPSARLLKISEAVETILECIGEDPSREGLLKTPMRYAKALMFFTKGYEQSLWDVVNDAVFSEDHDEMVIVKNITVHSLCEHHLVPFMGKVRLNIG